MTQPEIFEYTDDTMPIVCLQIHNRLPVRQQVPKKSPTRCVNAPFVKRSDLKAERGHHWSAWSKKVPSSPLKLIQIAIVRRLQTGNESINDAQWLIHSRKLMKMNRWAPYIELYYCFIVRLTTDALSLPRFVSCSSSVLKTFPTCRSEMRTVINTKETELWEQEHHRQQQEAEK